VLVVFSNCLGFFVVVVILSFASTSHMIGYEDCLQNVVSLGTLDYTLPYNTTSHTGFLPLQRFRLCDQFGLFVILYAGLLQK